MEANICQRMTDQIVREFEDGVRPWIKPWNAGSGSGRITRPLRANGIPYQGIDVLMLWSEAVTKGYQSPIWMTFKQGLPARKAYTPTDVKLLKQHSRARTPGSKIAKLMKRKRGRVAAEGAETRCRVRSSAITRDS